MRWVLVAFLLLWEPFRVAGELFAAAPMMTARGAAAAVELIAHASVAAVCAGAALALVNHTPLARVLAQAALVLTAVRSVQTLYWSALPRNIVPGDELPLALAAIAWSAVWIVYVRVATRAAPAGGAGAGASAGPTER